MLKTFKQYVEEAEYCRGVSFNVDFFWNTQTNIKFLTMGGKKVLLKALEEALVNGKMKVFDKKLTSYGNNPEFGFTYLIVLGQSHIIVHTWPEQHFMNVDIFTCGNEGDPQTILNSLKSSLKPEHVQVKQAQRGVRKDVKSANEKLDLPQQINTHPANN